MKFSPGETNVATRREMSMLVSQRATQNRRLNLLLSCHRLLQFFKIRLKRLFYRGYRVCERLGVHVTPVHYYSPLPDLRLLEQTQSVWARKSSMEGVRGGLDEQARELIRVCSPYRNEYSDNCAHWCQDDYGQGYGEIDAQALYAVMRHAQPGRVIEVGGGASTLRIQAGLQGRGDHLVVEPYPCRKLVDCRESISSSLPCRHFRIPFSINLETATFFSSMACTLSRQDLT